MRLSPWQPGRAAVLAAVATLASWTLSPAAGTAAGSAPLPIGSVVLRPGDVGPAVRVLQGDLWEFGFRPGPVSGVFGRRTERALLDYQASRHLPQSGVLDPATFRRFLVDLGLAPDRPGRWAALPIGSTVLWTGDTGPAVRVLQGDLWQLGFNPGPVNGVFGPRTAEALRAYQASRLLPPTGVLDPATFRQLLSDLDLAPGTDTGGRGAGNRSTSGPDTDAAPGAPAPAPAALGPEGGSPPAGAPGGSPGGAAAPEATSAAVPGGGPAILAYWSVWDSPAGPLADLREHASVLTWLSPYWYSLRGDGGLSPHEADHAQVLAAADAAGVPVLPLINQGPGAGALLSSSAGRALAVRSVVQLLRSHPGYGGVVIDFEQLPGSAQAAFTAFLAELRRALPPGATLGVAVMPKASSPGPDYAQVYDYAALGRIADFVQLMTYDRHGDGTPPGPISPNDWVARVARYAASVMPPQKVLLGVPGYGYDWVGTSATTIDATRAAALARSRGATPVLDRTSGEYHFGYTDDAGRRHTVWFESPEGVAEKYRLVQQLGLGGLALWTLGAEQPSFWSAATGRQG